MNTTLQPGQQVTGVNGGRSYRIGRSLGAGGQGEVLLASSDGGDVAIKWFFKRAATPRQRQIIQKLLTTGAPSAAYLWPSDLLDAPGVEGFGYVMPVRPDAYVSIDQVRAMRANASLTAIAGACRNLGIAFRALHLKGLAYFDIKGANGFFDPVNGKVLICDTDNVTFSGDSAQVAGTITHMAPEIIVGKAKPSTQTDLHSLAVLLFEMLVRNHPLEGKRQTAFEVFGSREKAHLYGRNPVFIFDPANLSNRPDPAWHRNATIYWSLLPRFVRERFVAAFTVGLHDPKQRVVESSWIDTFTGLLDCITPCPRCAAEVYFEPEGATAQGCWSCGNAVPPPRRLLIVDPTRAGAPVLYRIALHAATKHVPATRIYRDHLDPAPASYDRAEPVADVVVHPADPRIIGLVNRTTATWSMVSSDGQSQQVPPDSGVSMVDGVEIRFAGSHLVGRVV